MSNTDLQEIHEELQEIKRHMKGSDEYGTQGYKQKIEFNRRRVNEVDNKLESYFKQTNESIQQLTAAVNKIHYIVIGASIAASTLVTVLGWLVVNWDKLIR